MNSEPSPRTAHADEGSRLAQFEQLLPSLVEQAGEGLEIRKLREESCLRPEIEEQQLETGWLGSAAGRVNDPETANAALDRLRNWLDSEGWEYRNEVTNPPEEGGEIRVLIYRKDDVSVTATHRDDGGHLVEVLAKSPCTENPPEHQMQRSELDPQYGIPSQYYQDGSS
ncbi:hypothetical protein [Arthrobacter sp. 7Tela_A1]|uniref:hypothetical protein n=1 Tax=Arthrobacter sp. 7Tela_A1 TaxID=3093745 RepID=UPI003BB7DAEB